MPESKSRWLIFICIWLDCKFFRIIACMFSAYVRWQAQSQSPQTSSSFSCSLSPFPQCYLCIPSQFSTCTHRPLYKQDLRKHGLWFPTAGHWAGRHLPPLPSYVLYWNNTGTRSAWGNWGTWENAQPKRQPALPPPRPAVVRGESAGKGKGGFDTQLTSTGIANGDRRTPESTAGQNCSLY